MILGQLTGEGQSFGWSPDAVVAVGTVEQIRRVERSVQEVDVVDVVHEAAAFGPIALLERFGRLNEESRLVVHQTRRRRRVDESDWNVEDDPSSQ